MDAPVRIIPDKKYPNMYRLQWENGDISIRTWEEGKPKRDGYQESYGMYNKTMATDILKHYEDYILNMSLRGSVAS